MRHTEEPKCTEVIKGYYDDWDIDVDIKQALIDLLKDMPIQTLQIAYLYAKNYIKYGEDVTRTWVTATENSNALEKAYRKGYYDACKEVKE